MHVCMYVPHFLPPWKGPIAGFASACVLGVDEVGGREGEADKSFVAGLCCGLCVGGWVEWVLCVWIDSE